MMTFKIHTKLPVRTIISAATFIFLQRSITLYRTVNISWTATDRSIRMLVVAGVKCEGGLTIAVGFTGWTVQQTNAEVTFTLPISTTTGSTKSKQLGTLVSSNGRQGLPSPPWTNYRNIKIEQNIICNYEVNFYQKPYYSNYCKRLLNKLFHFWALSN